MSAPLNNHRTAPEPSAAALQPVTPPAVHVLTPEQLALVPEGFSIDAHAEQQIALAVLRDAVQAQAREARKVAPVANHRERIDAALHVGRAILDISKPDELVEGWLDRRSLAILYGASGSGKSFVALDIGLRVAAWLTWQSKQCNGGRVLYIVAEGSGDIGARVAAWLDQFKEPPDISNITFSTVPVNLLDPAAVDALVSLIKRDEYALIVVDTLARSMLGGDENASKDGGAVIDACDRLRDASGACVLLVHHTGYDLTHMRGTTAYFGASDTVLEVKKSDDLVILTAKKQKSRPDGAKLFLKLAPRLDSLVVETAHGSQRVGNVARAALQALADTDDAAGMTAKAWMLATGANDDGNFYRTRTDLVRRALVDNIGTGRMSRYRISDSGHALLVAGMA